MKAIVRCSGMAVLAVAGLDLRSPGIGARLRWPRWFSGFTRGDVDSVCLGFGLPQARLRWFYFGRGRTGSAARREWQALERSRAVK